MSAPVAVLEVLLHGQLIGTLTNIPGDRTVFAFEESYIADRNRPTLSLSFKDGFGELITQHRPTPRRLMPFFANLLPEGRLRRYLAALAGVNADRDFPLIWVLGLDLPGALQVRAADPASWPAEPDGRVIKQIKGVPEGVLRFSLAGMQLKFSAIQGVRYGLTIPARGIGGSWIVKLPSAEFPGVPENEFSMMTLAREVGITVPAIQLIDIAQIENLPAEAKHVSGQAFAIERFDRSASGAIQIEDFAQVFGVYPDEKYRKASYMNIAAVLAAETGIAGVLEFIRRLTFNVLIGNADMHLKNWSLAYPEQRAAVLAPAYDFVSTTAYIPDDAAALKVSRSKRFADFSAEELEHLASRAKVPVNPVLDAAAETVARFREAWTRNKTHLPLSSIIIDAIDKQLTLVPIAAQ
jgi:serine/threonine-protein kinase HipA